MSSLLAFHSPNLLEAGCDEVGRGCLAGPVVAAAVILPRKVKLDRLDDSKKLDRGTREQLEEEIKEKALAWAVASCSPEEIDEINILQASFLAMHRAVEGLSPIPEHLLVDGNRFSPILGLPHTCVIKGDGKYMSIAAASVLAKAYRDRWMQRLDVEFPGYSWSSNVGYPTIAHRKAIAAQGITPWHRKSFKLLPDP